MFPFISSLYETSIFNSYSYEESSINFGVILVSLLITLYIYNEYSKQNRNENFSLRIKELKEDFTFTLEKQANDLKEDFTFTLEKQANDLKEDFTFTLEKQANVTFTLEKELTMQKEDFTFKLEEQANRLSKVVSFSGRIAVQNVASQILLICARVQPMKMKLGKGPRNYFANKDNIVHESMIVDNAFNYLKSNKIHLEAVQLDDIINKRNDIIHYKTLGLMIQSIQETIVLIIDNDFLQRNYPNETSIIFNYAIFFQAFELNFNNRCIYSEKWIKDVGLDSNGRLLSC